MNVIAIHGLETKSDRTWVYKKDSRDTKWLSDKDMLPEVVPNARIYTYNWEANFYADSTQKTLDEHASSLLWHLKTTLGSDPKPILFIASCFGGLVVAEALSQADRQSGSYQNILMSTIGIVFLATPFKGTTVAKVARLQVSVGRILGKWTSRSLITKLDGSDEVLGKLRRHFTTILHDSRLQMPVFFFYETKETELLRRLMPKRAANIVSAILFRVTRKLLVEPSSAHFEQHENGALEATHSYMNKFRDPQDSNYKRVRGAIETIRDQKSQTLENRKDSSIKVLRLLPGKTISNFIGRKKELEALLSRAKHVGTAQAQRLTVITGLEGVGKTGLALEAAYRIRDQNEDWSIFWVSGNSYTSFIKGYREIADLLEVDARSEDVITLVNEKLKRRPVAWLLVIDEVDDTADEVPDEKRWVLTSDMLPGGQQGLIVITTGDRRIAHNMSGSIIHLLPMSEEEANRLLEEPFQGHLARLLDEPAARMKLVRYLTSLPLAISLASRYMARTETSVTQYLRLCENEDPEIIRMLCHGSSGRKLADHDAIRSRDAVSATWLVSFKRIMAQYPKCEKCLERMAFYHSKNIPIDMLRQPAETVNIDEVINILVAYSFVMKHTDQSWVDIHQLVQLAMKNWLYARKESSTGATAAINGLLASLPFPTLKTEQIWRDSIRHAEEALGYKDESVYDHSTWRLLYMVGQANFLFREDKKAKVYHERARKMESIRIVSKENPALASRYQGKYEQAEKAYQKEIRGGSRIEDQITTLTVKKHLACTFLIQGKHEAARAEYQVVFATEKELLGEDHPSTLSTMDSLAFILKSQGKCEEAKELYRKVLETKEKRLGKENISTVTSIENAREDGGVEE
ncbi:hypothetical protein AbraIFM66950_002735 [Aspergillus brasiliensis]|nr:hypothetical protein AbraIFM66950_002735 [Aspergillus brasiliensis]